MSATTKHILGATPLPVRNEGSAFFQKALFTTASEVKAYSEGVTFTRQIPQRQRTGDPGLHQKVTSRELAMPQPPSDLNGAQVLEWQRAHKLHLTQVNESAKDFYPQKDGDLFAYKRSDELVLKALGVLPDVASGGSSAGAKVGVEGVAALWGISKFFSKTTTVVKPLWRQVDDSAAFFLNHAARQGKMSKTESDFVTWTNHQMHQVLQARRVQLSEAQQKTLESLADPAADALSSNKTMGAMLRGLDLQPGEIKWLDSVLNITDDIAAGHAMREKALTQLASQGVGQGGAAHTVSALARLEHAETSVAGHYLEEAVSFIRKNQDRLNGSDRQRFNALLQSAARSGEFAPGQGDELIHLFERIASPTEKLSTDLIKQRWLFIRERLAELEQLGM